MVTVFFYVRESSGKEFSVDPQGGEIIHYNISCLEAALPTLAPTSTTLTSGRCWFCLKWFSTSKILEYRSVIAYQ